MGSASFKMREISNKVVRRDYSKIDIGDFVPPNLLNVQIKSYEKFLNEELEKAIKSISPIHSAKDRYTIQINGISWGEPKRTEEEAWNDGKTYDKPLYVDIVLKDNQTGEIIKVKKPKKSANDGIYFSNIPLITKKGTFIINGIEKVVIAQIVRSPGVYALPKSQIKLNSSRKKIVEDNVCEVLPSKGTLIISNINKAKEVLNFIMRDVSGESVATINVVEFLKAFGLTASEIDRIFASEQIINKSKQVDIYTPENILNMKEMEKDINAIYDAIDEFGKDEALENVLKKGHKLEKKLKESLFKYLLLKDELEKNPTGAKSNEIKHNMEILMNTIITEKAAKDIVKKMSISLKVFDNNNIKIDEEYITYQTLLWLHFSHQRYYDLTDAGRYKINRKLRISERLYQRIIAQDIKDKKGNVVFAKGTLMNKEQFDKFKALSKDNQLDIVQKINLANYPSKTLFSDKFALNYELVKVYRDNDNLDDDSIVHIIGVCTDDKFNQLSLPDFISIISYTCNLSYDIGEFDDIDHLGNKRLKLIHELLKNKVNAAMIKIDKFIKEKLTIVDGVNIATNEDSENEEEVSKKPTVRQMINPKPFQLVIKDFFNSHQLTQFIDQQNPLAELTNKRRISAMGPGGISREDPNLDIRDVHYSHYGRICPIETPEGMNIGLVMSLASFTKIDDHGFLLTPYRKVVKGVITNEIKWLTASQDDEYIIAEANVKVDSKNKIIQDTVIARYRGTSDVFASSEVDYIDVLPKQVISIAASSIPFLENNDANRALMGANMQRQATPLIKPYAPIVGTGSEYKIAHDSGMAVVAEADGIIKYIDSKEVVLETNDKKNITTKLIKYKKTNQDTCNNQIPIVEIGEKVKAGDILADGPAMKNGELALGQNVLVAFTTWSGYNYEDAIILSERLVKDDVYTSISIDEYTVKCLVTNNGDEEITRDVPNVSESAKKYLNEDGIIMVGAEVKEGDILVGKTTPKGHVDLSPEEKLLQAIFGEKTKPIKDSSLRVPYSGEGIVAAVNRFKSYENDDLGDDVIEIIKIYVVQKRKIQIGDKMAGRHGNKGIVSKIVPIEDMPHLEDGTPIDVMLNPLGVPSRMNIGQILEIHLGLAAREIAKKELLRLSIEEKDHTGLVKLFSLSTINAKNLYQAINNLLKQEKVSSYEEALKKIKTIDLEIILNTLGLSYADIGYKVSTPVFEGCTREDLENAMKEAGIDPIKTNGKFTLVDGRTGEKFDGPISIGIMYMLKLDHMVDDKIHSRAVGPYSKITQQPLGGKSQNGGQRFGEMEVWALEAYGAAYNLREILTIKSDDVRGRNYTYNAIIKGKEIPTGRLPETFKLLVKQLQGLCLYTAIVDKDGNEIDSNEYTKHENLSSKDYEADDIILNDYQLDESDVDATRPVFYNDDDM